VTWRSATAWIITFALLAFAGTRVVGTQEGDSTLPGAGGTASARVLRVIDGDTVRVRLAGGKQATVRYIGVDTPESVKPGTPVQCFAKAASAFNRRLVEGKTVWLRAGRERSDRYGRLLAYVYLREPERRFVNAELIARGYARTLSIAPNTDFAGRFARLERRARRLALGLWGACGA
jgi:micrococcal nuclease